MFDKMCSYMFNLYSGFTFNNDDVEFWDESDTEIDEDIDNADSRCMSPLNDSDNEDVSSISERRVTVRWIIVILSIFQTRFILTAEAMKWLLKFLVVLLRYLGKYSPKLTEIADLLPQSLYQYESSLGSITPNIDINKNVVCLKCESLYTLKECFRKVV